MTFVLYFTVRKCEHRKRLVSAQKISDNEVRELFEPLGWYVTLDPGGLSFALGSADPGFKSGQRLRLVLEPLLSQ